MGNGPGNGVGVVKWISSNAGDVFETMRTMGCRQALRRTILLTLHTCYLTHVAEGHRCSTRAVIVSVGGGGEPRKKALTLSLRKTNLKWTLLCVPRCCFPTLSHLDSWQTVSHAPFRHIYIGSSSHHLTLSPFHPYPSIPTLPPFPSILPFHPYPHQ